MTVSVTTNAVELIEDLGKIEGKVFRNLRSEIVDKRGPQVERLWVANATATAGQHGKHYPRSIKGRVTGPLEYTIRPTPGMWQSAMSFEEGSRKQPPHHDARRAYFATKGLIQYGLQRAVKQAL